MSWSYCCGCFGAVLDPSWAGVVGDGDAGGVGPLAGRAGQVASCLGRAVLAGAANASLRWYEDMDRHVRTLAPVELAYGYMTRTGRVDHAEVARRDPALAAAYEALHPEVRTGGRLS